MKRTILLAILGVTTAATAVYGDGFVLFENYLDSASPVTYSLNPAFAPQGEAGVAIGSEFSAELAWYNGVTANPSDLTLLPNTITSFGLVSKPVADGDLFNGAGYFFDSAEVTLPRYTSGQVTLEVLAFNGTDFASSITKGVSPLFLMTPAPLVIDPPPSFPDSGPNAYQSFTVAEGGLASVTFIPEPTTIALGGLGLAALISFRRKHA
jgi:hypothetical protein